MFLERSRMVGGMDFLRIIVLIAKNVPEHHTGATKTFLPQTPIN